MAKTRKMKAPPRRKALKFDPHSVDERTDWDKMEYEVKQLLDRLQDRPDRGVKPGSPVDAVRAFIAGKLTLREMVDDITGQPVSGREDILKMRRDVYALLARLQEISPDRGCVVCNNPRNIISVLLAGAISSEQAIAIFDRMIYDG